MLIQELYYRQRGADRLSHRRHTLGGAVEILQVLSGSGGFLMNQTIYPLTAGTVFLVDGEFPHCSMPSPETEYVRSKLLLRRPVLEALLETAGRRYEEFQNRCLTLDREESDAMDGALRRMDRDRGDGLLAMERLMQILRLCDGGSARPLSGGSPVDRALQYIQRHLSEALTIDGIAAHAGLSRWHLCHVFREKTGFTVMEYVRLSRLHLAESLLRERRESISAVSLACGFESFSYFSRSFKSATGLSPSQYRKAHGK